MNAITQLEIILVFSAVAWLGVVLLAFNKGASDFTTGETIGQVLLAATVIGFAIAWFF
jgi:hypothetical protein